jgi:hypothetical protein
MGVFTRGLLVAGSLAGLGYFVKPHVERAMSKRPTCEPVAVDGKEKEQVADNTDGGHVRHAGPKAMRDRPRRRWDKVDQAVDESFPASDPPGNY